MPSDAHVEDLSLSARRALNALYWIGGYRTVDEVVTERNATLLETPNVGHESLGQILSWHHRHQASSP